ncbi:MAG: hypothetical protein QNK04_03160 [Myxococcota bacterium]|nr:hypothetical protein [Myxococcota bacterium]
MIQRPIPLAALLVCALALPVAASAESEEPQETTKAEAARLVPTGSVTIEATSVSAGVGMSWGRGILTYRNENHPFRTRGFSLVGVGGASLRAEGTVFNLEKIEDFAGTWAEVSGSAVIGPRSSGAITLGNGNVLMTLSAKQKGAKLAAGGGAITIRFADVPVEDAGDSE